MPPSPTNPLNDCDFLEGCSIYCCPGTVITPYDYDVMAPFVRIGMPNGDGGFITVGNQSNPPTNFAHIVSFKYSAASGSSSGSFKFEVEIADEQGGKIENFLRHLVTSMDFSENANSKWMRAQWGWIATSCEGQDFIFQSTTHRFTLIDIKTQYTGGLMKYTLNGSGLPHAGMASATTNESHGDDDTARVDLKEAIIDLCNRYQCDVEFRVPGQDNPDAWNFVGEPRVTVREGSLSMVQVLTNWISAYKADVGPNGSGVTMSFTSHEDGGRVNKLILWAGIENCNNNACNNVLGTYIVNGGYKSAVLGFQPNLNFVPSFANMSGSGGGTNTYNNEEPNATDELNPARNNIRPGVPTYNFVSEDAVNWYGTRQAFDASADAWQHHIRANVSFNHAIEADLKIIGDPNYTNMVVVTGRNVALVVIDPFYLEDKGNEDCPEWLQGDPCNPVLSNRSWKVMGVQDEIKQGTYTTTLRVQLPAPGMDCAGSSLGGDPNAPGDG